MTICLAQVPVDVGDVLTLDDGNDMLASEPFRMAIADDSCAHIEAIAAVTHPKRHVCEECVKIGAQWVHLRTCQSCGVTLCCDSSPNRHATKHARATTHPVIASAEPGERWLYCYPDDRFAEY